VEEREVGGAVGEEEVRELLETCRQGGSRTGGLRLGGVAVDFGDEDLVERVSHALFAAAAADAAGEDGEWGVSLSGAAICIGAVTSVTRADPVMRSGAASASASGVLVGDNCCWQGLLAVLMRALAAERDAGEVRVVIVGGGSLARASCYALRRLPLHLMCAPPLLMATSVAAGSGGRGGGGGSSGDGGQRQGERAEKQNAATADTDPMAQFLHSCHVVASLDGVLPTPAADAADTALPRVVVINAQVSR